jgi:hypothetical protein
MGIFDAVRDKLLKKTSGDSPSDAQMSSASDQPQEDQELCSYVKGKVEDVRQHASRISHEGIWMTNIAYALGFDSVFYDPQSRQFKPSGSNVTFLRRNRLRANKILPAMQNRLARMLKNPPRYDVRPNSLDEEDKEAARLGVEVIGMVWDKQGINRKRIDLGMWLQECGHAYFKVSWDDEIGEPLYDPQTEEIVGFEGDIRIDTVSPFEMFPDPLAKTFEDCSWIAQAKVRKLDYFRQHYPDRGELVKEEGAWLLSAQYEMRINTLNSIGPSSSGTAEQMKYAAIEISYYEKRSKKYPKGRHVVSANGILLKNDDLPCGEIPFAKFDDIVVGGKYYPESCVTHARPLQDQYNKTLSRRADWTNKLLAGKYIAARGHGVIQEAPNDQSGEVLEYDVVPGAPEPKAMDIPVMPAYAYTETQNLEKDLYEAFGLSEVSRGQLPSASIPAQGMQILLEQDETRIGIEIEQQEYSYARVGELILKFADSYYIVDRKLKTKGQGLEYAIKTFNGEMLKKNFDCVVIRGSTIPNNKVMKRQEILNAFNQGLLGSPQDPAVRQKVLGILEYGDLGEIWEKYHLDMAQIKRSIQDIEQEIAPQVDIKDNHVMHILEKNNYRISDKFLAISPFSQQLLQADIQAHVQAGTVLANPKLMQPPDNGPPPDQMLAALHGHGQRMGIIPPGAPLPFGQQAPGNPGMPMGQSPMGPPQ